MTKTIKMVSLIILTGIMTSGLTSCSEDEPYATINVSTLNRSGDVKGDGGSTTKTFTFENTSTTVGWDMSSNATSGSFKLVLKDASGKVMLDQTLTANSGAQSADGTTPAGTAGTWTCTITLTSFNGTGDYSFL